MNISQADKINSLMTTNKVVYLTVPFLALMVGIFVFFGFNIKIIPVIIVLVLAFSYSLLARIFIKKNWLIDQLYNYLLDFPFIFLISCGIYFTGSVISPFIWLGIFAVINDTILYSLRKGLIESVLYIIFLWGMALFEINGVLPQSKIIPGFDPYQFTSLVIILLGGYTLMFFIMPIAVGFFSGQLRNEREKAFIMVSEKEKNNIIMKSIMEDLDIARAQLEIKLKDLENSRKATMHLLQDVKKERDASQEKEKEIKKLYEDLKVVDKMKNEFLSVISHELRTPLTPIMGYAEFFVDEKFGKLVESYKKGASVIKRQSEHLLTLIESIIEVARIERGVPLTLIKENINLRELIDEVFLSVKLQADSQQKKMLNDVPADLPLISGDKPKLIRVFANLLGNALKFTSAGGLIRVFAEKKDKNIEVQVIDNGVGLEEKDKKKIFDKFYQVDSSDTRTVGGMGLGLAIISEIIQTHGGKIWVESEGLGKGTRFIFVLPLV